MGKNDTITCAVTAGAGCVTPSNASVFQAVNKDGFAVGNNNCCGEARNGCWSGRGSNCENSRSGKNRENGCGNGCWAQMNRSACDDCDSCNGNQRNGGKDCPGSRSGKMRENGCNNGCWAQMNRSACDDCDSCNPCDGCNGNQRSGGKDCPGSRSGKGRTPAMVYEEEHQLCKLHELEEGIRKGTLFSELYMPMNGECADACGAQLCDGQAEAFAAWELRLYLNTHPCDRKALELFRKYARKADQPNYAGAFAFDDGCKDRWSWTDAPWPWEFNAACECDCD